MKKYAYIIENLQTKSISDLDLQLLDELFPGWTDDDHPYYLKEIGEESNSDGSCININKLIETLQYMKDCGCNYVSLSADCDHYGYDITGSSIYHASQDEINEHEAKLKKARMDKDERTAYLDTTEWAVYERLKQKFEN